jgi:regulator of sirC expression with transglutaminase-like and TPR domain
MAKAWDEKEFRALVSLLDDDDADVVRHVEEKILSIGDRVIPHLEEEWEKDYTPEVQRRIEELIHTLQFDLHRQRLMKWFEEGGQDLLEGLWIVATYQYPNLHLADLRKEIEQIYYQAWIDFKKDLHPFDQVKLLNNVLFNKLKFRPNASAKEFHSPSNSMINMVLESKKGNPISLCAIYMLVARKLDMPVYGVNLPNLFICTYKTQGLQFYINAFNNGIIFSKSDIDNYIQQLNVVPREIFFEPCTHADLVKRVLRNLIIAFEKNGEHQKSDEVKQVLKAVSPGEDDEPGIG